MLSKLRPQRFVNRTSRKFNPNSKLLGGTMKGDATETLKLNRGRGLEKMLLNKINFFYLTGNVFTLYCFLKLFGWSSRFLDKHQTRYYEDKISEVAAYEMRALHDYSDKTKSDYEKQLYGTGPKEGKLINELILEYRQFSLR